MASELSIEIMNESAMRQVVARYVVRWSAVSGGGPYTATFNSSGLRVRLVGSESHWRCREHRACDAGDEMLVELVELAQWCAPERCGLVAAKGQPTHVRFCLSADRAMSSAAVEIDIACPVDRTSVPCKCDGECLRFVRGRLTSIGANEL
jgi:hypothetical protein